MCTALDFRLIDKCRLSRQAAGGWAQFVYRKGCLWPSVGDNNNYAQQPSGRCDLSASRPLAERRRLRGRPDDTTIGVPCGPPAQLAGWAGRPTVVAFWRSKKTRTNKMKNLLNLRPRPAEAPSRNDTKKTAPGDLCAHAMGANELNGDQFWTGVLGLVVVVPVVVVVVTGVVVIVASTEMDCFV